jgi:hypothetical protein
VSAEGALCVFSPGRLVGGLVGWPAGWLDSVTGAARNAG